MEDFPANLSQRGQLLRRCADLPLNGKSTQNEKYCQQPKGLDVGVKSVD
jgi:hypothetical protein